MPSAFRALISVWPRQEHGGRESKVFLCDFYLVFFCFCRCSAERLWIKKHVNSFRPLCRRLSGSRLTTAPIFVSRPSLCPRPCRSPRSLHPPLTSQNFSSSLQLSSLTAHGGPAFCYCYPAITQPLLLALHFWLPPLHHPSRQHKKQSYL